MFNFLYDVKLAENFTIKEKGETMDTLETIKCPACGELMEKVFIKSEGINLDICINGCGGIFFDNREFDKFNEENEDISVIEERLKGKTFEPVDDSAERICPACGGKMVKNTTTTEGGVKVDDCYICGGKFLDFGELQKIRAEFLNDELRKEATIDYLFNKVGTELHRLDTESAKRKADRNIAQKLFYSLLDINE